MFCEQYDHTLDDKGRLTIPVDMRPELTGEDPENAQFYVTTSIWDPDGRREEACLYLWPEESFAVLRDRLNALSGQSKANRQLKRIFFGNLQRTGLDRQGRILIRPELKKYAGIEKNVVILGANDHVELWDQDAWLRYSTAEIGDAEAWEETLGSAGF